MQKEFKRQMLFWSRVFVINGVGFILFSIKIGHALASYKLDSSSYVFAFGWLGFVLILSGVLAFLLRLGVTFIEALVLRNKINEA